MLKGGTGSQCSLWNDIKLEECCAMSLHIYRPTHKESCKEQSEQKLRVNITKSPPSAGPGCSPEWSGVKQADIAKWAAGKMNNTPAPMPSPKTVKANINVKDQKLFVVKIQVGRPSVYLATHKSDVCHCMYLDKLNEAGSASFEICTQYAGQAKVVVESFLRDS